jgi:hypothetical protein
MVMDCNVIAALKVTPPETARCHDENLVIQEDY